MFEPNQYQLLDFGGGRKLERFGHETLDRPSPAAEGIAIADAEVWGSSTARFELGSGGKGEWSRTASFVGTSDDGDPWSVRHGRSRLVVQLSDSGNVGLFPEQADNWNWIAGQVRRRTDAHSERRTRVLNLFAYTGGSTLAAAAAGAEVVHIDSSGPTVASAKRNAEVAGLADRPVRWLVEDAMKFVAREERRGNTYEGIIADPPTYGHGPKGRPFKFGQHLEELLDLCAKLITPEDLPGRFLLFSCHSPGFGPGEAASAVSSVLPAGESARVAARPLVLESVDGRRLPAGVVARWSSSSPATGG